jgi:hypothetical protein
MKKKSLIRTRPMLSFTSLHKCMPALFLFQFPFALNFRHCVCFDLSCFPLLVSGPIFFLLIFSCRPQKHTVNLLRKSTIKSNSINKNIPFLSGRLIQAIFKESDQDVHPRENGLPPPVTRQFILRTVASRPLPASRPTPQRMYARLAPGEFVLAGAFTIDRQYL